MKRFAVCGGGLAGLAAATRLAEAGHQVRLFEGASFLGGRAGSWPDELKDGTRFHMERGFHAFFRQYYNLRSLIRRVDPQLSLLRPMRDYPILGPGGTAQSFRDLPRRTPMNLMALIKRADSLKMSDIKKVSGLRAAAMLAYGPHTYERWDHVSAKDYLDSLRFPAHARQMLFDVFSHSFFNRESELSAAELIMQFHFYFTGNPEGLIFDTMTVPFGRGLFAPLAEYLRARGVEIELGVRVENVEEVGGGWRVATSSGEHLSEGVVLALDVRGLKALLEASPGLGPKPWRDDVAQLDTSPPFVVWRLWLDRRARPERHPFAGTAAAGILDNISVYEKLEDESRAWSDQHGGSVIELHAYAVEPGRDDQSIREELLSGLHQLYPETRKARILEERYLRREDCPAFAPGSHVRRPSVNTPRPGLALAGDFVRLSFPSALMERAVASGFLAADHLMASRSNLQTVPPRGLLAGLRL